MTSQQTRTISRLEKALRLAGGTHSVADVIEAARMGRARVWEREDTIVVTEMINYPRKRVVRCWLCAGALDNVVALVRGDIEAWAREQGANSVEAIGRPGWRDAAQAHGFKVTAHIYEKDLTL